jgi:hypothetical protein
VSGHVRERRICSRGDSKRADGQPVETISEVDRIRGAHQHHDGEQHVKPAEIRDQILEEREDEPRVVQRRVVRREHHHRHAHAEPDEDLPAHLVARNEPMVGAPNDLEIVVGEADDTESCRRQDGDPDVRIRKIRPQQGGDDRRRQDQQSAHGRRSRLGAMRLRSFLPDDLPDLEITQLADHPGSEQQAEDERRQARRRRAKRDVARDVEDAEVGRDISERRQQPVQHLRELRRDLVGDDVGARATRTLDQHQVTLAHDRRDGDRGSIALLEMRHR